MWKLLIPLTLLYASCSQPSQTRAQAPAKPPLHKFDVSQGGLTPEQVRRVVMSRMAAFQACFELGTTPSMSLRGDVGIAFEIEPSGVVREATITRSTLNHPKIEGCMLLVFRDMKFPAAIKTTKAVFPFAFRDSPRDGPKTTR